MAKSISDKVDIKTKIITSNKKRHFRMIKDPIYQKDRTILNLYVPNIASKDMSKIWDEEKLDKTTIRNTISLREILIHLSQWWNKEKKTSVRIYNNWITLTNWT